MKSSISIRGMHCQSCARLISEALSDLEGVKHAAVSLETGKADIEYDHTKVTEQTLRELIESEGYEAR